MVCGLLQLSLRCTHALPHALKLRVAAGTLPGDVRTAVLDIESLASVKEFVSNVVQEHGVSRVVGEGGGLELE